MCELRLPRAESISSYFLVFESEILGAGWCERHLHRSFLTR